MTEHDVVDREPRHYKLLWDRADELGLFEERVNIYIEEGWVPVGNLCILPPFYPEGVCYLIQPLTRKENSHEVAT